MNKSTATPATSESYRNEKDNESVSSFINVRMQLGNLPSRRILRYDKKLIVIIKKVKSMGDELVDKIYTSSYFFSLIDQEYNDRKSLNVVASLNKLTLIK